MRRKIILISLITSIVFAISVLSGCSSKAAEAAKQIEKNIQEQQAKVKSFHNINAGGIDPQNAVNIVRELASEKYKGRKTGTLENEAAAEYIAQQFGAMGLKNPTSLENYMYYYNQPVTLLKDTPKLELLDKAGNVIKSYEYPKSFVFKVLSDSTKDINIKAPMKVIANVGEIKKQNYRQGEVLLFSMQAQGRSSATALMDEMYDTNASAVIVEVDVDSESRKNSDLVVTTLNGSGSAKYKPVITVDSATYAELVQFAAEKKIINIHCSYEEKKDYKAANVVGYIPGADVKLRNEYIIIGAHMDHVGDNMNGTYNPGALDNASGTAAMLEIARVMSEDNEAPKRTLIFIAFNGEESGLFGSMVYAFKPIFPLKKAVMINLDMVGSSTVVPLSVASSRQHNADLKNEFLELAKAFEIDAVESDIAASDHYSFGEKDVPSVLLTHMDVKHGYHSPNDTLEDIDKDRLKEVIELVLHYIDKKAY